MSQPDGLSIQSNPAQYFADFESLGVNAVLLDLLSHSYLELTRSPEPGDLQVKILGSWQALVIDNGRGVNLAPEPGETISHAEAAFGRVYPIPAANDQIERTLRQVLWKNRVSMGPFAANALASRMQLQSQRDSIRWELNFEYGRLLSPATQVEAKKRGTSIAITLDPRFFPDSTGLSAEALEPTLTTLQQEFPRIQVTLVS